jgi:hypothetical protein
MLSLSHVGNHIRDLPFPIIVLILSNHKYFLTSVAAFAVAAINGSTIRRSKDDSKGNRPSHVVSAWACDTSLVLEQLRVD